MRIMHLVYLVMGFVLLSSCGGDISAPAADRNSRDNSQTEEGVDDVSNPEVARDSDGRPLQYELLGQKLPAFQLFSEDGTKFSFDKPDTWMVISFWGIWCGDCRVDAPYKNALATAIDQDPNLSFMSVHTPPSARRAGEALRDYASVSEYMIENNYTFPVVVDTDARIRERAKIRWTPTYLIVDPDGIVRGFRTDLSVFKGEPVKDFVRYIAELKAQ